MNNSQALHQTVLLREAVDALHINPGDIVVDGTFGRGGHSQKILEKLAGSGKLIGIDKDLEAVSYATKNFSQEANFKIRHGSFADIKIITDQLDVTGRVNAVLLDLGISSPQIDQADRGMSFMQEGPLDMRMDRSQGPTCAEFLADIPEEELANILFKYGDEKFSRRIAKAIVTRRVMSPILTTRDLAQIIAEATPVRDKHKHPATRSFQALRIYLNQELEDLEKFLEAIEKVLAPGGRLVIISFHSLEDRLVKHFFNARTKPPELPRGLPIQDNFKPSWVLSDKKLKPSLGELEENTRARSAIMRAGVFLSN